VLLWREFLAIFAKMPHRAIRSGSDFPMHTSHLTRRGLVLALVGALLGLGLIHDGALAADSPAPKRFTLVDRSPSELAFSWSPVKGAASYKVKMSTSSSMTKPIYAMSSDASEKISGLKAGQTYYAKVRVTDKKGVARSSLPTVPAQVLDLTNWKLTTPAKNSNGDALEVSQPALATYRNASFFDIGPKGVGVLFTAAAGGATTSGSSYPRSELREMTGGEAAVECGRANPVIDDRHAMAVGEVADLVGEVGVGDDVVRTGCASSLRLRLGGDGADDLAAAQFRHLDE
jgi:hypothetical protein